MENKESKVDPVRAWKDEEYRESLTPEQLKDLPPNPAGDIVMSEEELDEVSGGVGNYANKAGAYFSAGVAMCNQT